jgi:hypothetical protein
VVDAFFAATRDGDFNASVRLHPDVVLHADFGPARRSSRVCSPWLAA